MRPPFRLNPDVRHLGVDYLFATQLKEELARLASFPQLNPNPIVEYDLDGTVTYINSATLEEFPDLPSLGLEHPIVAAVKKQVPSW